MIEYDFRKYSVARTRKEFLDAQAREGWEYVEGLPAAGTLLSGTASYDVLFRRSVPGDQKQDGVYVSIDGHTVGFVPASFGSDYRTIVSAVIVRGGEIVGQAMAGFEPKGGG